jgi:hypothetical protein
VTVPSVRRALLAAAVGVVLGGAVLPGRAADLPRGPAAAPSTSSNWAGYVATGPGSTGTTASASMSYTDVTGQWVEPKAVCDGTPTSVALWVGLGGFSVGAGSLEQAGTAADCLPGGKPHYYAWYELVPADSVTVKLKVNPGDLMTSSVEVVGKTGRILVQVKDRTRGVAFTRQLPMASPDLSSAEWIAEAPAECTTPGSCRQLGITRFGAVTFTHAYATGNNVPGTITAPSWTATAIELLPAATHRAYGQPNASAVSTGAGAMPLGLMPDGSGFTVQWQPATAASAAPA